MVDSAQPATTTIDSIRSRLGPVGVWSWLGHASMTEQRDAAVRIEELGYGSLWGGEGIGGKETFVHAAMVLSSTTTLIVGSGIANLWARHPAAMQGAASTLEGAWLGRFVLGVGVSHSLIVNQSGQSYEKPLHRISRYLEQMDAAAEPDVRSNTPMSAPVPRVLAALGPKMLELARDNADGAHPYFVPPEHTPEARRVLGPGKLLIPEQAVVLNNDAAEARRISRAHMEVALTLPSYINNLRRLGYGDDDLAGGGSDRLVDAIVG
jgi:probable F420-dependent oxidoreductase